MKTNGTCKRHIFIKLMECQTKVGYIIFIITKGKLDHFESFGW